MRLSLHNQNEKGIHNNLMPHESQRIKNLELKHSTDIPTRTHSHGVTCMSTHSKRNLPIQMTHRTNDSRNAQLSYDPTCHYEEILTIQAKRTQQQTLFGQ